MERQVSVRYVKEVELPKNAEVLQIKQKENKVIILYEVKTLEKGTKNTRKKGIIDDAKEIFKRVGKNALEIEF